MKLEDKSIRAALNSVYRWNAARDFKSPFVEFLMDSCSLVNLRDIYTSHDNVKETFRWMCILKEELAVRLYEGDSPEDLRNWIIRKIDKNTKRPKRITVKADDAYIQRFILKKVV